MTGSTSHSTSWPARSTSIRRGASISPAAFRFSTCRCAACTSRVAVSSPGSSQASIISSGRRPSARAKHEAGADIAAEGSPQVILLESVRRELVVDVGEFLAGTLLAELVEQHVPDAREPRVAERHRTEFRPRPQCFEKGGRIGYPQHGERVVGQAFPARPRAVGHGPRRHVAGEDAGEQADAGTESHGESFRCARGLVGPRSGHGFAAGTCTPSTGAPGRYGGGRYVTPFCGCDSS